MKYDKKNGDVIFREEDHVYANVRYPDLNYISVTTIIGLYHEQFDSDFFSKYKALEKLIPEQTFKKLKPHLLKNKYWNDKYLTITQVDKQLFEKTVHDILVSWDVIRDEACEIGTEYHLEKENELYEEANTIIKKRLPHLKGDFKCIKHDFSLNREKAVMPEYLVYYSCPDKILNLAGQIDVLVKDGNDITILDFKTNKKGIESKAYFNPKTRQTKKMFYPINNVEDCMLQHYTLQLSIYAWMLQKANPEFNIKELKLLHIDREKNETEYIVPYLKDEVTKLLAFHKKKLKKQIKK